MSILEYILWRIWRSKQNHMFHLEILNEDSKANWVKFSWAQFLFWELKIYPNAENEMTKIATGMK